MEVIPAIDLMDGRCVQLVGGDPETRVDYGDPVEKALEWRGKGARMLHIVDLNAALGGRNNFGVALKVKVAAGLPVEYGGGIRSPKVVRNVLNTLGEMDKVMLGTLAVSEHPDYRTLKELSEFGERIIVAVDSKEGYVAVKGWVEKSKVTAAEVMRACGEHIWGFLYTDVDVEGRMGGINADRIKRVVDSVDKPVIVSGGVSSKKDVDTCRRAGAWGVVLGKALYEGKIKLEDVI